MKFEDIPAEITETAINVLENHLALSTTNLIKDRCVLPMLMTQGNAENSNNFMSLQPKNGQTDVDKALSVATDLLKNIDFEIALFSYSTKIGLSNGKLTDALKSYIIMKDGLTIVFFTPYRLSGFIKKKAEYNKSIIGEIIDNIFE